MKQQCLKMLFASMIILASVQLTFAQLPSTNTFPPTGKAGIGTINPQESIHIKQGTIRIDQAAASSPVALPQEAMAIFDSLGNLVRATSEDIQEILEGNGIPIPDPGTGSGDFWKLTGNTGIVSTTHYLGTNNLADLRIKTNSLERMSITSDGIINAGLVNALKGMNIVVYNTDPSAAGLYVETENFTDGYGILSNVIYPNTKALSVQRSSTENFYVRGNGQGYFAGSLGIGTNSPGAKLDIKHNDSHGGIILNRESTTTSKSQISYRQYGIEKWSIGTDLNQDNSNNFFIYGGNAFQPRLLITPFGDIGIGTINPAAVLEVNGAIRIGMLTGNNPATAAQIGTLRYNSVIHEFEGYKNDPVTNQNGWVKLSSQSLWKVNGTNMYYNDGNIGLGTDIPLTKLDVRGDGRFGTETEFIRIGYINANSVIDNMNATNSPLLINYYSGNDVIIGNTTAGSSNLVVSGNVGIGTGQYLNDYKLAVDGVMISTEVRVKMKSNWPDYVFDETHELMPVHELQAFIQKYKHLPNIPSAEEVKQNDGIALGEMNAKLLEKIEELTLYMLNQQKQIDELKAKICE